MQLIATKNVDAKLLGAFYTPATIAGMLAEWVVQTGNERLLEPSVGDGALIAAAITRRRELRGAKGELRFLACDIDPSAIEAMEIRLPDTCETRAIDFLQLDPLSTGLFTGILANPPFTRNHSLEPSRRDLLRTRLQISGAAGLWVHFLVHSMEFLAPRGRLAAIIPASALFTNYGRVALERICNRFAHVEIRQIVDKPLWVNGAEERGALIFASGFGTGKSPMPAPSRWRAKGGREEPRDPEPIAAFERLAENSTPLGDLATLSIGAVTGCNSVFLLSEAERLALGIPLCDVQPIASRARQLPGITVSSGDLLEHAAAGEKAWLLTPSDLQDRGSGSRNRLAQISRAKRRNTVWLNKRDPWWRVQAGPPCDAIFTYMNDSAPRLVLADLNVRCTNTLHRVTFRASVDHQDRIAAALSMMTTFGQLAAERIGRAYGGGLLKFELMDARRLPVLLKGNGSLDSILYLVDAAMRAGERDNARELADLALVAPVLGKKWKSDVKEMEGELATARSARKGGTR